MPSISTVALSILTVLVIKSAHGVPLQNAGWPNPNNVKVMFKEAKAFAPATALKVSDRIVTLKGIKGVPRSSQALMNIMASEPTTLNPVMEGYSYGLDVGVGGQTFTLIFDSGSSDLWVAEKGVKCKDSFGETLPTFACGFGLLYSGKFSEGEVPNQNFNITYASQEYLIGTLGFEDVTLAGVTVNHQEFASVDEGYWIGDALTSGVVGFAYSALTAAYPGTDPSQDDPRTNNLHYVNFIGNAIAQGTVDPLFSHVLERGPDGGTGQLALGGLPNVEFDQDFTSVPLQIIQLGSLHPIAATNFTYYTIYLDGIVVDGTVTTINSPAIVDSGTTLAYLPAKLVTAINSAFDPPAQLIAGLWEADCNATPPQFSFCIGDTHFGINAAELLIPEPLGYDPITGLCVCGIQPQSGVTVLGDTFLKNVVAVYDIGASEMRFASYNY